MQRIELSTQSLVPLVVGNVQVDLDIFELRLWSEEAGNRLGSFDRPYFDEMGEYLVDKHPALEGCLGTGQLLELHNLVQDATEALLQSQKKRNTSFVESLTGTEGSTLPTGLGNGSGSGVKTLTESSPSGSGTSAN